VRVGGQYAVQGHLRSMISISNESLYALYILIHLTPFLANVNSPSVVCNVRALYSGD